MPIARRKGMIRRIERIRKIFNLTLRQTAAELRITQEWLSKLVNGHHPISYNVGLRVDDMLRRRGVDPAFFDRDGEVTWQKPAVGPHSSKRLRTAIDRRYRALVRAAGNDVARLRWISEQVRLHLAQPPDWRRRK